MMNRWAIGIWIGCSLLATMEAQCTDDTTRTYDYSKVSRLDGNAVRGYSQTSTYGNYASYWQPYLSTTWIKDGTTLASNNNDTNATLTVSRWYTSTLQFYGPGQYRQNGYHNHWNKVCKYWHWDTAAPTTDALTVVRPARPDYAATMPRALWYLGQGVQFTGANYSAVTVFTPGAANGAPESPVFVVSAGSNRVSLSCTSCPSPIVTATAASSGCQTYDVVVNTSYNGFLSEPFFLFINRPWNLVAGNDNAGPDWCGVNGGPWVWSCAQDNGYRTHVNYQTKGLCALDPPMSGYDLREEFPGLFQQSSGVNWDNRPNGGTPGHLFVNGSDWADNIFISNPGSVAGAPAICAGGVMCTPQFTIPGAGPHTLVQWVSQSWHIGSQSPGQGARVQTNTLEMYTDSGWHSSVTTPNP